MLSTNCTFSQNSSKNFYVHQPLLGLNFMILAYEHRNNQEMACWSFNHFTTSCCFVLLVYFQAVHSYSFVLRYILCFLLAIEHAILLSMLRCPEICISFKAFSQFTFTLMAVENNFQLWMKVKAETTTSEIITQYFIGLIK